MVAGIDYILSDGNLIERYQTLLTGVIALAVGYFSVKELRRQIRFSESLSLRERQIRETAFKNQIMYELRSYFQNLREAHYGHRDAMRCLLGSDQKEAQRCAKQAAAFAPKQVPPIFSDITLRPYLAKDADILVADIKDWFESFHHSLRADYPELWMSEPFNPGFEWFHALRERTDFTRRMLNNMVADLMGFKRDDLFYV